MEDFCKTADRRYADEVSMADLVLTIQVDRDALVHGLQHGLAVDTLDVLLHEAHVRHLLDEVEAPRRPVSRSAMLRSAVFIVPTRVQVARNAELLLRNRGAVGTAASLAPDRLDGSIRVMSSPNILAMLPRLISR